MLSAYDVPPQWKAVCCIPCLLRLRWQRMEVYGIATSAWTGLVSADALHDVVSRKAACRDVAGRQSVGLSGRRELGSYRPRRCRRHGGKFVGCLQRQTVRWIAAAFRSLSI